AVLEVLVGEEHALDGAGAVLDGEHGHLLAGGAAVFDDDGADGLDEAAEEDALPRTATACALRDVGDGHGEEGLDPASPLFEGVAGDVEAQDIFFAGECLGLGPRGGGRESYLGLDGAGAGGAGGVAPEAEERDLAAGLVACGLLRGGHGLLDGGGNSG